MSFVRYNPRLKELARRLRNESTLSEILLWRELKQKKIGFDFHRQKPIDEYIVDFYAPELQLIIEIDGGTHNFLVKEDLRRQQKLETLGFHFLRFLDSDVKRNLEGVILHIQQWIQQYQCEHTPSVVRQAHHPEHRRRASQSPLSRGEFKPAVINSRQKSPL